MIDGPEDAKDTYILAHGAGGDRADCPRDPGRGRRRVAGKPRLRARISMNTSEFRRLLFFLVNDPALLANRTAVRWAGNNYFTSHIRNVGLMALALDPARPLAERHGRVLSPT